MIKHTISLATAALLFEAINISATENWRPEFSTAGFFQVDPQVREALNFNIGWRFLKGDCEGAEKAGFDDSEWPIVNTPHGLELVPLAASGSCNYQGVAWYRKHFNVDSALQGKKVFLHFEAIMGKSKVWVNGKLVKEHFGVSAGMKVV